LTPEARVDTLFFMGQYQALLGKRVEARYRGGDLHLSMCGVLVAESKNAIVLEDRFFRNGREKTIRVEIPHAYVMQVQECPEPSEPISVEPASGANGG
jgi:hypothetical protein